MTATFPAFSQRLQNCIRDTAKMFLIRVGDDPALYDCWRVAMRPYLFRQDNGLRLNRGAAFGDCERLSRDAVSVPIFESRDGGRVVTGVASMQTYTGRTYTDEHVRAFEVTADLFVGARALNDPAGNLHDLLRTAGVRPVRPGSVDDLVDGILSMLKNDLQPRIEALASDTPMTDAERRSLARELHDDLLRVQIRTSDALGTPGDVQALLDALPPRARQVAELVADKRTDTEIMTEMNISLGTVKTYLANVREAFDVRSREGIIAKLRPFG
jgi:DNA-binding CsgD family transcriptional regulator